MRLSPDTLALNPDLADTLKPKRKRKAKGERQPTARKYTAGATFSLAQLEDGMECPKCKRLTNADIRWTRERGKEREAFCSGCGWKEVRPVKGKG
jgi:hypothetical protein